MAQISKPQAILYNNIDLNSDATERVSALFIPRPDATRIAIFIVCDVAGTLDVDVGVQVTEPNTPANVLPGALTLAAPANGYAWAQVDTQAVAAGTPLIIRYDTMPAVRLRFTPTAPGANSILRADGWQYGLASPVL